ncbi:hypothetical protein Ancab_004092 [Ancistrocladus abbreviatus]
MGYGIGLIVRSDIIIRRCHFLSPPGPHLNSLHGSSCLQADGHSPVRLRERKNVLSPAPLSLSRKDFCLIKILTHLSCHLDGMITRGITEQQESVFYSISQGGTIKAHCAELLLLLPLMTRLASYCCN